MEQKTNLDAYTDDQADKARATGKPIFLRKAQREGWTGELPLYLLHCEPCNRFTVTHPAGYGRITCLQCFKTVERVMTWQRFRDKVLKRLVGG